MYHFKKSTKSFSKKFGTEVCLSHSCLSVLRPDECFQVAKNLDCRRISSACLRFVHVCHETAKCLNSNISMFYFAFQGTVTRRFWEFFVCFLLTEVVLRALLQSHRNTHMLWIYQIFYYVKSRDTTHKMKTRVVEALATGSANRHGWLQAKVKFQWKVEWYCVGVSLHV